jgi:MoxR-like ATPase
MERVQFTSDLLPADILGTAVYQREQGEFVFHPGPIFTHVLLADEINRTSPKTQSALLEAMEEGQVTIEGTTRPLAKPFFVIATQNPLHQSGTFALPESQLDRFLMRISLGYPSADAERQLLSGISPRQRTQALIPSITLDQLLAIQQQISTITLSEAILDYLQRIIAFTREHKHLRYGLSPRGSLALTRASKAWAYIEGRDYVIPEDVQQVLPCVIGHRISSSDHRLSSDALIQDLLQQVDVLG